MASGSLFRHFYVYGGPEGGAIASVDLNATSYVYSDQRRRHALPYSYVLVAASHWGKAFVPRADDNLLQAFQNASHEPGDRESETLAAEIQRRGLEI